MSEDSAGCFGTFPEITVNFRVDGRCAIKKRGEEQDMVSAEKFFFLQGRHININLYEYRPGQSRAMFSAAQVLSRSKGVDLHLCSL